MDGRKKLVPFMKRMIGKCPGVIWEDEEQGMFRIPWRHFNNREWTEDDSKIFLEWAKCTGKYRDGDEPDWPTWKTQLRCALNKIPEIEPVKNLFKLDPPNPYRVYRFVSTDKAKTNILRGVKSEESDFSPSWSPQSVGDDARTNSPALSQLNGSLQHMMYFSEMTDMGLLNKPVAPVPTVVTDEEIKLHDESGHPHITTLTKEYAVLGNDVVKVPQVGQAMYHTMDHLTGELCAVPAVQAIQMNIQPQNMLELQISPIGPNAPDVQNTYNPPDYGVEAGRLESDSSKPSLPSDLKSVEANDWCMGGIDEVVSISSVPNSFGSNASMPSDNAQKAEQGGIDDILRPQIHALSGSSLPAPDENPVFSYRVYYGFQQGNVVKEGKISRRGCRVFYSQLGREFFRDTLLEETPDVFGPKHVDQVQLDKPCMVMPSADDVQKSKLLELLENMERGLVLFVHGQNMYARRLCKTRVFVTDRVEKSDLVERQKSELTPVFIYKEQYDKKQSSVTLTFGQEIRKGQLDRNPMKKVLLSMEIEHLEMKHALMEEHEQLSFNSYEPLISHDDMNDKIIKGLSQFKLQ